jgi:zinc protease
MATTGCGQALAGATTMSHKVLLSPVTHRFSNGLTLSVSEDHSLPMVAVSILVHAGVASESQQSSGFAHLFEHLLSTGPTAHIDREHHATLFDVIGGYQDARTDYDYTMYNAIGLSSELNSMLWIESDRMGYFAEAFTQETLDGQRRVVTNERRQRVDNIPSARAQAALLRLLFPPPHPYGALVFGTDESLAGATVEDVKQFYRDYYTPGNLTISIVGDVRPADAILAVDRFFGTLPARPTTAREAPHMALPLVSRVQSSISGGDQTEIMVAFAGPPAFKDGDVDMDILAVLLGQGDGSWLYSRLVRERKVATEVMCAYRPRELGSLFLCDIKAAPGIDASTLQDEFDQLIAELRTAGPAPAMVERAFTVWESSFFRSLENLLERANTLNRYALYAGTPAYLEDDVKRHRSVTTASAKRAAMAWLDLSHSATVVLQPAAAP